MYPKIVIWAFAALIVFGLWVSLEYSFSTWGADSDTALPYLLWHGILKDGPGFIHTFSFTPDNWLFWPLPTFFAAFATIGDTPQIVIVIGWAIFICSVVCASLLVNRAAGPVPAAAAGVVLLLSNRSAIGDIGFLTYPLTHNASLLAGLFALYILIRWIESGGWYRLVVATVALAVADASDPWIEAAFSIPICCAAAWLIVNVRHVGRSTPLILLAAVAVTVLVAHTQVFGLLSFIPGPTTTFASPSDRTEAFEMLGRIGALWFNFLPGRDADYPWDPLPADVAADMTLLLIGLAIAAMLAIREYGRNVAFDMLWLIGSTSWAIVTVAYVMVDHTKVIQTGRYFMASYVFGITLFAASLGRIWRTLPRNGRIALTFYSLLLPTAGLASGTTTWTRLHVHRLDRGIADTSAFLEAHDLHYGYGTYWGAQASGLTWLTRGKITIRPVFFDHVTGYVAPLPSQTSSRWYDATDVPRGQRSAFLIISKENQVDNSGCRDVEICTEAVERQFGLPQHMMKYRDTRILIWDYLLFGADPQAVAAHIPLLLIGRNIDLTSTGNSTYILGEGWSLAEPLGTWTDATKATILLHVPVGWTGPTKVTLEATAFTARGLSAQDVIVSMHGRPLTQWKALPGGHRPYTVTIPASLLLDGCGILQFAVPGAISPHAATGSSDGRQLGINVRAIQVSR